MAVSLYCFHVKMDYLKCLSPQTVDYLTTTVFPKMRGTDHSSLLVYLDLVKRCVQAGASDIVSGSGSGSNGDMLYVMSTATSGCINTNQTA